MGAKRCDPMRGQGKVLLTLIVCLGLLTGSSACGGDEGGSDDRLATATELAEAWMQGWSLNDPDEVMSVFTEDGRYVTFLGREQKGREAIGGYAVGHVSAINDVVRVGDFSEADDGTFVWVAEATVSGVPYRGTLSMELEGDLISDLFWLEPAAPID